MGTEMTLDPEHRETVDDILHTNIEQFRTLGEHYLFVERNCHLALRFQTQRLFQIRKVVQIASAKYYNVIIGVGAILETKQ